MGATRHQFMLRLCWGMPGNWADGHISRAFKKYAHLQAKPTPPCIPTWPWEYLPLIQAVPSLTSSFVWDPWAGKGGTRSALQATRVLLSDVVAYAGNDFVADALCPDTHARARRTIGEPYVIVTSPWFSLLDLFIPLAAKSAATMTCVQAPVTYLTQGPPPRTAFFRSLAESRRLCVVMSAQARNPLTQQRALWIVICQVGEEVDRHICGSEASALVPLIIEGVPR